MQLPRWLGTLLFAAIAQGGSQPKAEPPPAQVVDHWEWTAYWDPFGLDFPLARYPANRTVPVVILRRPNAGDSSWWGFCSTALGICQAYRQWSDGSIQRSASMAMRIKLRESRKTAVERFCQHVAASESARGAPAPSTKACESVDIEPAATPVRLTFPALKLPVAIRKRIRNSKVEELVKKHLVSDRCATWIPFADESTDVPIFAECKTDGAVEKRAMMLVNVSDYWALTAGGELDAALYERRIKRHAALVLR